jgi:hypothetical protein
MDEGASEAFKIFLDNEGKMPSYIGLRQELEKRFQLKEIPDHQTNAKNIKNLMFKSRVLKRDYDDGKISLVNMVKSGADLLLILRQSIVKCILDNIQDEPDVDEISSILYGSHTHVQDAKRLVQEYNDMAKSEYNGVATPCSSNDTSGK